MFNNLQGCFPWVSLRHRIMKCAKIKSLDLQPTMRWSSSPTTHWQETESLTQSHTMQKTEYSRYLFQSFLECISVSDHVSSVPSSCSSFIEFSSHVCGSQAMSFVCISPMVHIQQILLQEFLAMRQEWASELSISTLKSPFWKQVILFSQPEHHWRRNIKIFFLWWNYQLSTASCHKIQWK